MSERWLARRRLPLIVTGFFAGMMAAFWWMREPTAPLTRERLDVAVARWDAAGVVNYEARYRMHGSDYAVSVRDGIVVRLKVNDHEPGAAELASYSISGLFRVLDMELDHAERLPLSPEDRALKFRARFDSELGYPERYIRGVTPLGRATSLEMLEFRPVASVPFDH